MYTIIWDIDDTLNEYIYRWFIWYKFNNSLCNIDRYEDITINPPYNLLNITKERYLISIDKYKEESYYILKPKEEIFKWFEEYGYKAEHIVLTSSPIESANISSNWVFKHFGNWIRSFNIVPSKRRNVYHIEYHKNKAHFIKELNKEKIIFIDDNEKNIKEVEKLKLGIDTFCVKQPWNTGISIKKILKELTKRISEDED